MISFPMQKYPQEVNSGVGQYMDPVYFQQIGAVHPGQDFNGNGGGNTDLGRNVRAIHDGKIVHCRFHRVWGWIILIEHPDLKIWSQYAHHQEVFTKLGEVVKTGQRIATVGRGGNDSFLAHLHFEIRVVGPGILAADSWPTLLFPARRQAELHVMKYYRDPVKWLIANKAQNFAI